MALKDYTHSTNQCIINNHSEFIKLLKWFLKHGAENYCGGDIPMFETLYHILNDLDVRYENYENENCDEENFLINNISELEVFLLNNVNENTLVPSDDEYPILVSWYREESFDRFGDTGIKILNFTSLKEIKPFKNYLTEFFKNLRKENNKWRKRKIN